MQKPEKAIGVAAILLALCLIYVLSIGPVVGVLVWSGFRETDRVGSCVCVLYSPIIYLHDHTAFKEPIEQYVDRWDHLGQRLR